MLVASQKLIFHYETVIRRTFKDALGNLIH